MRLSARATEGRLRNLMHGERATASEPRERSGDEGPRERARWGGWRGEAPQLGKGGSNSVVESQPSKLLVAGSIPVSRSSLRSRLAARRLPLAGYAEVAHCSEKREGGRTLLARTTHATWRSGRLVDRSRRRRPM